MVKLRSVPSVRRVGRADQVEDDAAASDASPASLSADIRGLVDNATSDRLYGWVWDAARPEYHLKVELRLAGETVASTVADLIRPDLAANGVGDGSHAFEFPLTEDWLDRRAELTIVAIGEDGTEIPIDARLRRPDDSRVSVQLQLAVESLRAEQQQIRTEFAGLRERVAQLPEPAAINGIIQAEREVQQRLDALEMWISRLDDRLGKVVVPRDEGMRTRLDPWQAALLAVLASLASAAMALAAAHLLV